MAGNLVGEKTDDGTNVVDEGNDGILDEGALLVEDIGFPGVGATLLPR